MLGRRSSKLRYVPLVGLLGVTLAASLVPGVAGADQSISTDVPEWAQDTGESTPDAMTTQATLPSAYDLRNDGLVTPVKQQGPFQSCWSFGGSAAAESSILSSAGTTYADTVAKGNPLNLSESHLVWFSLHPVTEADDPAQAGEGIHLKSNDKNAAFNNGGSSILMTTLYAQGVGPLPESAFPYRGKEALTTKQVYDANPEAAVRKAISAVAAQSGQSYDAYLQAYADAHYGGDTAKAFAFFKEKVEADVTANTTYSDQDDWSIPETDGMGRNTRLLTGGYVLKNGNYLPDYYLGEDTDPNQDAIRSMKQELLNGRGIMLTYHADQGEYTSTGDKGTMYNQYVPNRLPPDHGVCIVGWDDNYSKDEFIGSAQPTQNGAWIVKNSWGSETDCEPDDLGNVVSHKKYGINDAEGNGTGYFYLSYYDRGIWMGETVEFSTNLAGQGAFQTMQYDYMPLQGDFHKVGNSEAVASSANVFEPDENVVVRSVSTQTAEENMRVTMALYALDDDATEPTDGTLLARTSSNFEYSGFHRVDLDNPIDVKAGQRIAVVSTASKVAPDGKRVYVASANTSPSETTTNTCVAVVNKGESYVYTNNKWTDWKDYVAAEELANTEVDNFSIKLYATPGEPTEEGQDVYRLYNPYTGEHFYTTSAEERDALASIGWNAEGTGWVSPKESDEPVYRLYNPYTSDHHYTTSANERDELAKLGWVDEGVGWYSGGDKPVYRQFNPYETIGSHNFTTSKFENDELVKVGWNEEGIAWMSM